MNVRRVATGHNAHGKAVVVSDVDVEGITLTPLPGAEFHRLWGADVPPRFPDAGSQPAGPSYFPPLGGFRFMMFTVAPHTMSRRAAVDRHALLAEMEAALPGLASHMEPNHPGMHTTDTIDFDDCIPVACVLGGTDRRTLLMCVAADWKRDALEGTRTGRILATDVAVPGAGRP